MSHKYVFGAWRPLAQGAYLVQGGRWLPLMMDTEFGEVVFFVGDGNGSLLRCTQDRDEAWSLAAIPSPAGVELLMGGINARLAAEGVPQMVFWLFDLDTGSVLVFRDSQFGLVSDDEDEGGAPVH